MQTKADENLADARRSIQEALNSLSEIVVRDCPGSDDFNALFKEQISNAFQELLKMKEALK